MSLGSAVAAYAIMGRATEQALSTGTYSTLTDVLDYASLNTLMRH